MAADRRSADVFWGPKDSLGRPCCRQGASHRWSNGRKSRELTGFEALQIGNLAPTWVVAAVTGCEGACSAVAARSAGARMCVPDHSARELARTRGSGVEDRTSIKSLAHARAGPLHSSNSCPELLHPALAPSTRCPPDRPRCSLTTKLKPCAAPLLRYHPRSPSNYSPCVAHARRSLITRARTPALGYESPTRAALAERRESGKAPPPCPPRIRTCAGRRPRPTSVSARARGTSALASGAAAAVNAEIPGAPARYPPASARVHGQAPRRVRLASAV